MDSEWIKTLSDVYTAFEKLNDEKFLSEKKSLYESISSILAVTKNPLDLVWKDILHRMFNSSEGYCNANIFNVLIKNPDFIDEQWKEKLLKAIRA